MGLSKRPNTITTFIQKQCIFALQGVVLGSYAQESRCLPAPRVAPAIPEPPTNALVLKSENDEGPGSNWTPQWFELNLGPE